MSNVWFLEANCPLTKRFSAGPNGTVLKHPYPHVTAFTSHEVQIKTPKELFSAIKEHAHAGHCLIKGRLHAPLHAESRAGSTVTNDPTDWLCLDLDRAPFASPDAFMRSIPILADVSCITQYSSSHGLHNTQNLSCHIFILLDGKVGAPNLKAWLMELNLTIDTLREAITLTRSNAALHWPLDITACQNDKLLYIAPPIIGLNVQYKIKSEELIQMSARKLTHMPVERIVHSPMDKLNMEKAVLLNAKRDALHLPKLRSGIKFIGEHEVQPKPGHMMITEIKEERDFRYFNINGGDSWGYYQPLNNLELIHNFKGEPSYITKEIAPDFYREQIALRRKEATTPTAEGDIYLGICELRTAKYWKVVWNPAKNMVVRMPATNEVQLRHFLESHGKPMGDFIEQWTLLFDPQDNNPPIDMKAKRMNTYIPSMFYREYQPQRQIKIPNIIEHIIQSAVSNGENNAVYEHFLNWLACIFQYRCKTRSAWVLSGTHGTGKGLLVSRIITPLLGYEYVAEKRNRELEEPYNGWLETALIAFVDEVQVSSSSKHEQITQDLMNMITEPRVSIRRMHTNAYLTNSFVNFIFSSNKRDPVQLTEADRRFNFGDFQDKKLKVSTEDVAEGIPTELPVFFNYLMQRKADKSLMDKIIVNETRRNVVHANLTSIDVLCNALAKGDLPFLWESRTDSTALAMTNGVNFASAFNLIMNAQAHATAIEGRLFANMQKFKTRLSRDELIVIFEHCIGKMPTTPNKFTSMLKHHNIALSQMRIRGSFVVGLEVEWSVPMEWLEEHRTEFTPKPPGLKALPGGKI